MLLTWMIQVPRLVAATPTNEEKMFYGPMRSRSTSRTAQVLLLRRVWLLDPDAFPLCCFYFVIGDIASALRGTEQYLYCWAFWYYIERDRLETEIEVIALTYNTFVFPTRGLHWPRTSVMFHLRQLFRKRPRRIIESSSDQQSWRIFAPLTRNKSR